MKRCLKRYEFVSLQPGERGRGVERDSERDSEREYISTGGLWCLLGDLEGSKPAQGWSGRCTWRRICLCSQGRWTKRTIWVGIDTFFRNFLGELHDLKSYGPYTLSRGPPSELWTASTLAERTGSLSISPQDPLLPGRESRKVGKSVKFHQIALEFYWLRLKLLVFWTALFSLHPFFQTFAQDFPAMKAFISWRSAGRRGRMAEAGHTVEERVFLLHSWFCFLDEFHWMCLSLA